MGLITIDRHSTAPVPPLSGGARQRLVLAVVCSLLLHLALVLVIRPVPRPSGALDGGSVIEARLEHTTVTAVVAAVAPAEGMQEQPKPEVAPAPKPAQPASPAPQPAPETGVPAEAAPLLPQVDIPLLEDPTYYPGKMLDVHPAALQSIKPAFPDLAARKNLSGVVTLLLLIDELGTVRNVSVVDAQPEGYFEESAIEAFRNARFSPGRKDGRVVKSRVLIRVNYETSADSVATE